MTEPPDGERTELGPHDRLEESAQDWAAVAAAVSGKGVASAAVYVNHSRGKIERDRLDLDRERLEFDRQKFEAQQRAQQPPESDS
jgi:hypothetical protein